jgi:S1-C subfamily serine protease
MGAQIRLATGNELSAYGVSFDTKGLAIDEIDNSSRLGGDQGLQKGDLILELNRKPMTSIEALRKTLKAVNNGKLHLRVIRNQKETMMNLEVKDFVKL